MRSVQMAHNAMATQWEILLYGTEESYLRAVGEEAFREIDRIETLLSLFRSDSETRRVNVYAGQEAVPVDPRFFALLQQAIRRSEESEGAFDITVGPLMELWGFYTRGGEKPEEAALSEALARVGWEHILLNPKDFTVQFDREGVVLDFGAIGKGYAVECVVTLLRDFEISSALLHGGTSTIYALGVPPEAENWTIAIQRPFNPGDSYLARVALKDRALSVSAPHGKWFASEGRRFGHVIDPRTGIPSGRSLLAALVLPSATESDALSTALLTNGIEWLPRLQALRPDSEALIATAGVEGEIEVATYGEGWMLEQ